MNSQSCSVGSFKKEECHKTHHARNSGMKQKNDFNDEDIQLILWRTEMLSDDFVDICLHHEQTYLHKYETLQYSCCNPFLQHKHVISKGLRVISVVYAESLRKKNIFVKPGGKICSQCRSKAAKISCLVLHDTDETTDPDFKTVEDKTEQVDVINKSLTELECSPLKFHSLPSHSKESYGKRKLSDAAGSLQKKLAGVLEISPSKVNLNKEADKLSNTSEKQKAADLDNLITLMQEKMTMLDRNQKIQLLTIAPSSWSSAQLCETFPVTDYMVRQSRELLRTKGLLALPEQKRGKKLPQASVDLVVDFYQEDEYSRQMPGQKDKVSVSRNVHVQKRLILCNLSELYSSFAFKYPDIKIGFSKFCSLRPKWCVLAGSTGTHSVCVCTIHQNVKLLLTAASDIIEETYATLISHSVCSLEDRTCMLSKCPKCPGKDKLKTVIQDFFNDCDMQEDTIEAHQWQNTDRSDLITVKYSIEEYIDTLVDKLFKLKTHSYIAKSQSSYLKEIKEKLDSKTVIVLLDFSENYSFVVQDEAQSYHWTNGCCTLHPFVIYYKDSITGNITSKSFCILSDDMQHDVAAVYEAEKEIVKQIKVFLPAVSKINYFSDGCAAQYKNCKNFLNLCHHDNDFHIEASWTFFATSHGKSACDGIGGTVKRLTSKASLQRPYSNQITTSQDMFMFCKNYIPNISFMYISKEQLQETREFLEQGRFQQASTVTGTRGFHQFIPLSTTTIGTKIISADTCYSLKFNFTSNEMWVQPSQVSENNYLSCVYDCNWWIGLVQKVNTDEGDVDVKFMHPPGPSQYFYWPNVEDTCPVPFAHILSIIDTPVCSSSTARKYKISVKNLKATEQSWNQYQRFIKET